MKAFILFMCVSFAYAAFTVSEPALTGCERLDDVAYSCLVSLSVTGEIGGTLVVPPLFMNGTVVVETFPTTLTFNPLYVNVGSFVNATVLSNYQLYPVGRCGVQYNVSSPVANCTQLVVHSSGLVDMMSVSVVPISGVYTRFYLVPGSPLQTFKLQYNIAGNKGFSYYDSRSGAHPSLVSIDSFSYFDATPSFAGLSLQGGNYFDVPQDLHYTDSDFCSEVPLSCSSGHVQLALATAPVPLNPVFAVTNVVNGVSVNYAYVPDGSLSISYRSQVTVSPPVLSCAVLINDCLSKISIFTANNTGNALNVRFAVYFDNSAIVWQYVPTGVFTLTFTYPDVYSICWTLGDSEFCVAPQTPCNGTRILIGMDSSDDSVPSAVAAPSSATSKWKDPYFVAFIALCGVAFVAVFVGLVIVVRRHIKHKRDYAMVPPHKNV